MGKKTMRQQHGLAGLYGMVDPAMGKKMAGLPEEDTSQHLTGQLMVMEQQEEREDGRVMFAMFGVVALPKEVLKDMHQYPVAGIIRNSHIDIIFSTAEGVDRKDMIGMGVDGCLTQAGWKV